MEGRMKKRNKLEVIKDILEVLQKNRPVKITHLIYKANQLIINKSKIINFNKF